MKKLVAIAALLMATTAAHAGGTGITFEIDGQRVHVEAPRNCSALSCIRVSAPGYSGTIGGISKNLGSKSDDDGVASTPAPPPPAPPAPAPVQAAAPQPAAPFAAAVPPPPAPPASVATAASAPVDAAPIAPAPAPVAAQAALPPQAAPVAAAAPTGPIGVWATEENKGNVRVEACGANLCGYSEKSNERILINMKADGSKWSGRIHDPDSGRNYDSTIAMKGPNAMRVQGCAFGGMFCGGQTWKRVS
ncbi:DUF2147 domain-containing protein [Bradyrhizobium sp. USDA 4451]